MKRTRRYIIHDPDGVPMVVDEDAYRLTGMNDGQEVPADEYLVAMDAEIGSNYTTPDVK